MTLTRILFCVCLLAGGGANAQEPVSGPSETDKSIAELKRELGVRDQVIRNLIQRIEQLERAVMQLRGGEASTPAPPPTVAQTQAPPTPEQDIERIRAAFERTLIDRGGLTLPKWAWEVDTGLNYGHSSSEALTIDGFTVYPVLIVGDIVSERVRRDTLGLSVTARLGLPWQTQVDLRIPYSYENSARVSADGQEDSLTDQGIGDIELGFSRPLWRSGGGTVDLLGALRWKMTSGRDPFELTEDRVPFGTGFHVFSGSVTAVTAQDPMVFFGTLTYSKDLPAIKNGQHIDPGDGYGLQLGAALAVNLDTSMSFSYQQQFNRRTRVDGVSAPGSFINTGSLSLGFTHALDSGKTLDTSLVIGLTEDSPDLQLNISMPFRKAAR